ncbi:MAG: diguanylate cyclase [Anaerolineales bacterium]|nr:diguanylate cyclase [Anaerolineales bacterium]
MVEQVKILVAEDEAVSRQILKKTLESWGYDAVLVSNGDNAWKILNEENPPRLAILDWVMPGMDGLTICRKLRERKDDLYSYILLLTANAEKGQIVEGLEAGADDYLVKPYNPIELKARIETGARIIRMQQELVRIQDRLRIEATHDNLTGLWNRGTIFKLLEMELAREARDLNPVGALMIDLDKFKLVNDTYGHLVGDQVLKEFANRLNAGLRSYDLVGRYGGDEFLVVLPNCSIENAEQLAGRVVQAIQAYPFETDAGPISVNASIGVTATIGDELTPPDSLVSRADEALYVAKRDKDRLIAVLPLSDSEDSFSG